ncbi:pyridoxal phosphate-dependent decarboxylase family protein [Chryseobacterium herbae]|uniref:Pyridoxal-dependent decarboxylase n=1 Tax=Chryseobacterium herbae TaxID=2976476 RepID=A0ABT2IU97_9FLAO|nr:pyridoxal-dependent decarboxylase [Chryseobacterium sp. pc1-10]MCT2562287.1 pyridoxal-dependent decarboxylase [Chryseobacterium sp. pc1-10]
MKEYLKNDSDQIDHILEIIKNQGIGYLNTISERPTSVSNMPVFEKQNLPEQGFGTEETLKIFNERFEPIMVGSGGPRYLGFVTGGATPASIAGDWLATIYDQNTQSTKGHGDISANIELETIKILLDLLGLPDNFLGGFVTGATMSNFTCLAIARQWVGKEQGRDIAKDGISGAINILTATPHSSAIKSLSLLGIGSGNITKIKTAGEDREAISVDDLEDHIIKLGGEPFILISSGGTVNTVDFDDFKAIHALKEKYKFWWHIDAAFGGFAACSDTYKHLVEGWEYSDSITVDCHKWLNVPYESAVFFIKEQYKTLQVETFQNSNAPYLGDPLENFSYLNFLPENSRRLKALPAWFSLMAYGKKGYQEIVDNNITLSRQFGQMIENSDDFKLLAPVRLNTVCFTLKDSGKQDEVGKFLAMLNETGKVFMTPTFYHQQNGIRAAFVNWRTSENDVVLIFGVMNTIISQLK